MKKYVSLVVLIIMLICFEFTLSYYGKRETRGDLFFSQESGFYQEEFDLFIDARKPGLQIYYTLDGTTPSKESYLYDGGIHVYDYSQNPNVYSAIDEIAFDSVYIPANLVNKAMIISAVAYNGDDVRSEIVRKIYFVGKDYGDLPVISLVSDPEGLFGYEKGIYVKGITNDDKKATAKNGHWSNFCNKGMEWEREALVSVFEGGALVREFTAGIRIRGGGTRYYEQKSFSVYLRKKYGSSKLEYKIWEENVSQVDEDIIEKYESFILRNWGNNFRMNFLGDALIQNLVRDRAIGTQASRTCVVYLNGEYWGLYDWKEKYDEAYFEEHYGVKGNEIIAVKAQSTADARGYAVEIGESELVEEYDALVKFAEEHDLSFADNYEVICEKMDMQSFIDLFATRIYTEAVDFPSNNWECWKTITFDSRNPYQDARWRWMLYDVDIDWSYPNYYDSYEIAIGGSTLFAGLIKNEDFKRQFVVSICDLSNYNFEYDRVTRELERMQAECRPYVLEYYDRFGPAGIGESDEEKMVYFDNWILKTEAFFANQKTYMQNILLEKGLVSGKVEGFCFVKEGEGAVRINTLLLEKEKEFYGEYFVDYPVVLTAVPENTFLGWYDKDENFLGNELTISVSLSECNYVKAKFQ